MTKCIPCASSAPCPCPACGGEGTGQPGGQREGASLDQKGWTFPGMDPTPAGLPLLLVPAASAFTFPTPSWVFWEKGGFPSHQLPFQPISLAFCFPGKLLPIWKPGNTEGVRCLLPGDEKAQGTPHHSTPVLERCCKDDGGSLFPQSHGEDNKEGLQPAPEKVLS